MAVKIMTGVNDVFLLAAPLADVWALLGDIERSAACYPNVQDLVSLGDDVWRWEFAPTGAAGFTHQIIYTCKYQLDEQTAKIEWSPVPDSGTTRISGKMTLREVAEGVEVTFETTGELLLPAPKFMKKVATSFAQGETKKQIATYIKNLQQALTSAT